MEAFCTSCKFSFDAGSAGARQPVKCPVCGRPSGPKGGDSAQPKSKRKAALNPGETECASCGKVLKPGVRFCAACGTNNYDAGEELAGVVKHLSKSTRKRAFEEDTGVLKMIKAGSALSGEAQSDRVASRLGRCGLTD